MALQASVQRRAGQVRDRGLQDIETVVRRQERVPPKGNDHCFLSLAEHGGTGLPGPRLEILHRLTLAPLRNGLRIDPEFPAQRRGRSLRSLYCCSDGGCGWLTEDGNENITGYPYGPDFNVVA